MWIKSGTFTGLNTDAWITNYAVGVGTFDLPSGTRLAAGGMKVTDTTVSTPQLNVSGVSTFSNNINIASGVITTTGNGGVGIGSFLRLKPHLGEGGEIAFDYVNGNAGYYLDVSAGNVFRLANYDATGVFTVLTNSTERLRVSNAGNLGIGTNNPTSKLDIIGDVKVLGVSTFTNANNSAIQIRSGASGSYTALGIGRVSEEGTIAIASGAGIYANNAAAGDIVIRNNNASGKVLFTRAGANASLAVDGDNVLVGTVSSTGTTTQPLQVTGGAYVSGNLGIGNTNPGARLDVAGDIRLSASDPEIEFNTGGPRLKVPSANTLTIHTGGGLNTTTNEAVRINTTGVGIGTNNPTVTLQLSPTASISNVGTGITLPGTVGSALTVAQFLHANTNTSYIRIKATRNSTGSDWLSASTKLLQVTDVTEQGYIEYNPNGSTSGMAFGSGATEWARFTSAGNFGIGVTNPSQKFEVSGTSRFFTSGAGDVSITHSSLVSSIRGASTVQLALGANNSESIRINTSGFVGIGTATPAFTADIAGDARVTSTNKMRFGGTAGTTNFYIQYNSTANSLDFVAG
jgi:hypothetical protein